MIRLKFMLLAVTGFTLTTAVAVYAQNRDTHAERVVLDDDASDGGFNTLTLQVPGGGLSANRIFTFPDVDGTVATSAGPLTANRILFGSASGDIAQSANLLWNGGTNTLSVTGIVGATTLTDGVASMSGGTITDGFGSNIFGGTVKGNTLTDGAGGSITGGTGSFSAVAVNGLIAGTSSLILGEDTSPTPGRVVLHDNTLTNSFTGTLQAANTLTANRTYTFQDASGTVAFLSDVTVTTNSTLLGNGTGGDPLRLNLSNTNTWTGTQTFGQVAVLSIATFDADMTLGDSPTDAITVNGTLAGATPLSFEGSTSDVNETSFAITDPTADRTITFQDASGTVAFLSDVTVTTNSTLLGDGTGGDPLRLNLSNTNTWTGTQTFGQVAVLSIATFDADMTLGDSPTDAITVNGTLAGATPLSFEGSTSDVNETSFAITDPTADRTITFPDASGTVALLTDITVTTDATLAGDGSGGSPLGIDLTNANSWSGAQTFESAIILNTAGNTDALVAEDGIRRNSAGTETFTFENTTVNEQMNIVVDGTITTGNNDFAPPEPGRVYFHDATAGTFLGQLRGAGGLTADRTYTLPDADGTVSLVGDILTDATLTGDGASGTELGIDLTNANSWTGAQTFSSVDINGGAIDGTTIGATTPAAASITNLVVTGTSDLRGTVSNSTGTVTIDDVVTINSGGTTDLRLGEASISRNSAAAETLTIENPGTGDMSVLINEATPITNSRIVINDGHWTSQQTTAPGAAAAGLNVTGAALSNATDVAGFIDIETSASPAAGAQATVTFDAAYVTAPIVVISSANGAAAGVGAYVTSTDTDFLISFIGVPAGNTNYQFYYQVIETQ